jgi:hypothetical protein
MQETPEEAKIYREHLSSLEFVRFVLLPRYLATVKTALRKRDASLSLPERKKRY